jgi:hypothetical protein
VTATTYRSTASSAPDSSKADDGLPAHGTTARAKGRPASGIKGCRCPRCTHAVYIYNKAREAAALAGSPYTVDTAAVADHINTLIAAGASANGIAAAARTGTHAVQNIHNGTQPTMWATTAARILAVTLANALNDYHLRVNAIGSARRVRALMAAGHELAAIRADCEPKLDRSTASQLLNGTLTRVRARTDSAIRVAYDRLSNSAGTSARNRLRAERKGWAVPAAWDDIDMDDPSAFPDFTGHCGSLKGHRLHETCGIPICDPCRHAKAEGARERRATRTTEHQALAA